MEWVVGLVLGVGLWLVWSAFTSPPLARRAARRPGRLAGLLGRAGVSGVRPGSVVALCVACGLVAGLAVQVLSRTAPVALVFAAMASYVPLALLSSRARRRRRDLAEVWPEAVDNLASAVRAGLSLPEALGQLGERGPTPLRPAFVAFADDYQVTGRFGECLDRLKDHLADPVGDRVVEALRVARDVGGGDLGRLLRSLSVYLREDAYTRAELESRQSWTRNGARVAVSAPWLVLLLLCFQADVIARYSSPGGVVVLAVGGASCLLAYRLMLRIGRLPEERRVLA